MTERRYNEAEVRKIFELATSKAMTVPAGSSATGLTLADMQSVATEVGIESHAITRAAAMLDAPADTPPRKSFGMPIEVRQTVPLPRNISDDEWTLLVAELRSTFHANGTIMASGTLKEWSVGNLSVRVEPSGNGYQLRMSTLKGNASALNLLGTTALLTSAAVFSVLLLGHGLTAASADAPMLIGGAGLAGLLSNFTRLPRWTSARTRQMQHIGAWLLDRISAANPS